jgi:hypothetical protein
MERETNIIEFVKTRRYLMASMKLLLTPEQRSMIKERTRYYQIKQHDL